MQISSFNSYAYFYFQVDIYRIFSIGMFYDWFTNLKLDKNFVYRCIDRYKVFIETQKDIYLSQSVPERSIQLIKKIDNIDEKKLIADKIQNKEILSSISLKNYLVSRARQDNKNIEIIKKGKFSLVKTSNQISIKIKGDFDNKKFKKLAHLIEDFLNN